MKEYRAKAKSGHAAKIKSYSTGKDGTAFRDDKPWDGVPILDSDEKFDEPQKVPTRKAGGRVEGKVAKKRLDRAPRKKGGRVCRDDGGAANDPETNVSVKPVDQKEKVRLVGYKKGGAVHSDEAEDRKLIRKMVKKEDLTGRCYGGREGRAEGGAVKKKGSTTVVINLGAQGAGAMPPPAQRIPVPVPVPAGPGMAQPGAGGPPPGGAPMGVPGAPPPNPMARKRGGRVGKDTGGMVSMKYGARSGEGRLEKEASAKKAGL
jgi:hypothetical protein